MQSIYYQVRSAITSHPAPGNQIASMRLVAETADRQEAQNLYIREASKGHKVEVRQVEVRDVTRLFAARIEHSHKSGTLSYSEPKK